MVRLLDELRYIRIVARERMARRRQTCPHRRYCLHRQGDCAVVWRYQAAAADGCSVRVSSCESHDCRCVPQAVVVTVHLLLRQPQLPPRELLAACEELLALAYGGNGRSATVTVSAATRPTWLPQTTCGDWV